MKPYLFAERNVILAEGYDDIDSFISDYGDVSARLEAEREKQRIEAEEKAARRRAEIQNRISSKKRG